MFKSNSFSCIHRRLPRWSYLFHVLHDLESWHLPGNLGIYLGILASIWGQPLDYSDTVLMTHRTNKLIAIIQVCVTGTWNPTFFLGRLLGLLSCLRPTYQRMLQDMFRDMFRTCSIFLKWPLQVCTHTRFTAKNAQNTLAAREWMVAFACVYRAGLLGSVYLKDVSCRW